MSTRLGVGHVLKVICLSVLQSPNKPKVHTSSEADTLIIARKLESRYTESLIQRMNQTARISLQIPTMSNSVETKTRPVRPNLSARPPVNASDFPTLASHLLPPLSAAIRSVRATVWRLSAAGEGGFTVCCRGPQEPFFIFFDCPSVSRVCAPVSAPCTGPTPLLR